MQHKSTQTGGFKVVGEIEEEPRHPLPPPHRRRKRGGGYAGDLTPQLLMWGILICISPRKNLIPSHANCMQYVLRCWERQSDDREYKTRSSADADNRLDAFSGQSRSTNMVPFHM